MRVLLVEDQADLARQVKRALERVDHQISIASDGPSAVLAATEKRFDLIVLDVNL
ncbi:MAG: response regulator, partial [Verrucomicrobiia bacterium]